MAVTTDMTAGSNAQSLGGGTVRISNIIDVNEVNSKNSGTALVSTDIIQCLDIPAGMHVKNVFVKMLTPAVGTALTATVGDATAANGWDASVSLKGAAGTVTCGVGGTDALVTTGKLYTAADTIDLVCTVDTITAWPKFMVVAECFNPTYG